MSVYGVPAGGFWVLNSKLIEKSLSQTTDTFKWTDWLADVLLQLTLEMFSDVETQSNKFSKFQSYKLSSNQARHNKGTTDQILLLLS